jgi:hypothetical protein
VPVRTVRGDGVESAAGSCVSDGVGVAAVGACDASTRDAVSGECTTRHAPFVVGSVPVRFPDIHGMAWHGSAGNNCYEPEVSHVMCN